MHAKRFLRISLSASFIVVTAISVWLAVHTNRAIKQRQATAWVTKHGGSVVYDSDATSELSSLDDYFQNVVEVELGLHANPQVTDLAALSDLKDVRSLTVFAPDVADLSPLAKLNMLQQLTLIRVDANTDLTPLGSLTNLEELIIRYPRIDDLEPLAGLTNLKRLDLRESQVSDLTPLSDLTELEILDLTHAEVTDVSPLAELTNLKWLSLAQTKVSDIAPLTSLAGLEQLLLDETPVAGAQMKQLSLALPDCWITTPSGKAIRTTLPNNGQTNADWRTYEYPH